MHFGDIVEEKQARLKAYIKEVTGVDYLMQKDGEIILENSDQSVEILHDDLDDLDDIDDLSASIIEPGEQDQLSEDDTEDVELDQLPALEEEDLLNLDIEESIDSASDSSDFVEDQELSLIHI